MNSVSGLALDFGYELALDFGLDLMQLVNWQRHKDYRKQIPIVAHAVNSVSDFVLIFGHGLSSVFGLDDI